MAVSVVYCRTDGVSNPTPDQTRFKACRTVSASQLFARIQELMMSWVMSPVAAAVFGSAARGDGAPGSDVDLFIVRPEHLAENDVAWGAQVAALSGSVRRWSGNTASIIRVTLSQVASMIERREPIVVDVLRNEALRLLGPHVLDVVDVVS